LIDQVFQDFIEGRALEVPTMTQYEDAAYSSEKLRKLIFHLAVTDDDLRGRFRSALHLVSGRIFAEDFPQRDQERIQRVLKAFNDLDGTSLHEFTQVVDRLFVLYSYVQDELEERRRSREQREEA
jgi:hypothetical protein